MVSRSSCAPGRFATVAAATPSSAYTVWYWDFTREASSQGTPWPSSSGSALIWYHMPPLTGSVKYVVSDLTAWSA